MTDKQVICARCLLEQARAGRRKTWNLPRRRTLMQKSSSGTAVDARHLAGLDLHSLLRCHLHKWIPSRANSPSHRSIFWRLRQARSGTPNRSAGWVELNPNHLSRTCPSSGAMIFLPVLFDITCYARDTQRLMVGDIDQV